VAFFLEYLDRTLKTPDDVARILGLPLLAVIPTYRAAAMGTGTPALLRPRQRAEAHWAASPVYAEGVASPLPEGGKIELLPQLMPRLAGL